MDGKLLLRRSGIAGVMVLALLVVAAAGTWAGVQGHAWFMDSLFRQIEAGELEKLRSEIDLLDRGDLAQLRERLVGEQTSHILRVCTYAHDASGSGKTLVAQEWKALRQVATQRRDHPVPPMAGGGTDLSEAARTVNARVSACLEEALQHPAE
jgi:hypothetical protein